MVPRSVRSDGPLAVQLASSYGLTADDWQADAVDCTLCRRRDGRFAAAVVKITIPRQNGKNGILEVRELYGMVILGEKFLHTAHEVKTARKAFRRIASFFENPREFPELAELVMEIRKTNGQEAILLTNGGSIEFIARSSGSGRGFTVDVLVCDEDQDLTDEELAALLPTISAAPLGNPQVILTGTPPDPEKPDAAKGEVARRVRKDAIAKSDPRLFCLDFGVPDGPLPDIDDRDLWAQTNPALGGRLSVNEVERERKLMSAEVFARERLGWWGDPKSTSDLVNLTEWTGLMDRTLQPPAKAGLVVDVEPDRSGATIGVGADGPGGRTLMLVKVIAVGQVVAKIKDLLAKRDITELALTPGQAQSVIGPALKKAGIEFVALTNKDMGAACAGFLAGVPDPLHPGGKAHWAHAGQAPLDTAIKNARTRMVGENELWDRKNPKLAMSPIVAGSTAAVRWRAAAPKKTPPAPRRAGARKSTSATTTRTQRRQSSMQTAGF